MRLGPVCRHGTDGLERVAVVVLRLTRCMTVVRDKNSETHTQRQTHYTKMGKHTLIAPTHGNRKSHAPE